VSGDESQGAARGGEVVISIDNPWRWENHDTIWSRCAVMDALKRDGFCEQITGMHNPKTGELMPVDIYVHADDLDWALALWYDIFALDWELDQAVMVKR
jgi:hypothetical protein